MSGLWTDRDVVPSFRYLGKNKFTAIPDAVYSMTKLQELYVVAPGASILPITTN
jgi:hypothetical protein